MRKGLPYRIASTEDGATAVEFALIAPVFFMVLVGSLFLALLAFTFMNLHFAVEDAARCAAVRTTLCPDSASTISYAQSQFLGVGVTPTFTYTAGAACGYRVTGTATFTLVTGVSTLSVPLTATACYP